MLTEDRIKEIIAEQGYKAWLYWRPRYSALRTRDETASVYAVVARRQRYLGALHLIILMREDELRQLIRVKCAAAQQLLKASGNGTPLPVDYPDSEII